MGQVAVLNQVKTDAQDDPPRTCEVKIDRDCLPRTGCVVSAINNMVCQILNTKPKAQIHHPEPLSPPMPHSPLNPSNHPPPSPLPNAHKTPQTTRIRNSTLPPTQRYEALKFLLHLLGDIHQPLHTEAEGHGGNSIPVLFNGTQTNLHAAWDNAIPAKIAGGQTSAAAAAEWAQRLDESSSGLPTTNPAAASLGSECPGIQDPIKCALSWAADANAYICSYVLADDIAGVQNHELAGDYYGGAKPVVEALVRLAGLRLAAWINALALEERPTEGGWGKPGGKDEAEEGKAPGLETHRKDRLVVQMDENRRRRFWQR